MTAVLEHPINYVLTESLLLPSIVEAAAAAHPDRPFVSDISGATLSYGQLRLRSLQWANALEGLGVARGETVAVLAANGAEAIAVWLGVAWLGAIEVSINTEYRGRMLIHALNTCRARLLVADRTLLEHCLEVRTGLEFLQTAVLLDEVSTEGTNGLALFCGPDLLPATPSATRPGPAGHDIACAMYTSGTTGASKCVLMPWAQLYASATGTLPQHDLGPDDCLYIHGPNYHIGGKGLPYLMALVGGRIGIRPRFSLSQFWPDVARFGATVTTLGAATTNFVYTSDVQPQQPRTLRRVMMAPLTKLSARFAERFGVETFTCYSMTELSMPFVGDGWNQKNWRSCGRVRKGWPGYEVRIVDERDYEVPIGAVGELVVRTAAPWTVTAGYLNAPERTAEAWRNGWFHTGDAFRRDADGYFYFVDRLKDAIRRRGENISSQEVEAEVLAHPAVMECAAVAVPSDVGEDEIKVVVVSRPGQQLEPEDLVRFLIPRVTRFMIPRYIEVVDALPRTGTQKVQKAALREGGVGPAAWDREAAGIEIPR